MRASLLIAAAMLVGCRTWDVNHPTALSSSGQRLCAKHRVPLVAVRAYQPPTYRDRVVLVRDLNQLYYAVVGERSPNHIPEGYSLRPTGILREPTTISYCPECEREFVQGLRVLDEHAAAKFVADAPPMWTPAKGVAKGPYQASLRDGVWTVRCFTTDGYRLTVRIEKEKGRWLSYNAAK